MNRILILMTAITLAGCSGGNAGTSSGSGGANPTTGTTAGGGADISSGEYNGNIDFAGLNSTASITIDVETNGNVTVTSNDSGSTTGSVSGNSFSSSGTISFNLGIQTCTGFTTIEGSGSGATLSGTVSTPSANCVENGVTSTISLDGTFTANQ